MNPYRKLMDLKGDKALRFGAGAGALAICPDMGGRTFAELGGISLHRIDLDCAARPDRPFNNFGGGNFWPAPEGGPFGFNYRGTEWYVQDGINKQPFQVVSRSATGAALQKSVKLTNRAGVVVEAEMRRELAVLETGPAVLKKVRPASLVCYRTVDSFEVGNRVPTDEALLACWTLEQFDTSNDTVAFCSVSDPRNAINFDFYDHPGARIAYGAKGFTYRTDGRSRGQIGVRRQAKAEWIGFVDVPKGIVCLRVNRSDEGLFFNIADNDQPGGPFSAADNYSIFNSNPDMSAFELETIGGADIEKGLLKGSRLVSETTFALMPPRAAEAFLTRWVGCTV